MAELEELRALGSGPGPATAQPRAEGFLNGPGGAGEGVEPAQLPPQSGRIAPLGCRHGVVGRGDLLDDSGEGRGCLVRGQHPQLSQVWHAAFVMGPDVGGRPAEQAGQDVRGRGGACQVEPKVTTRAGVKGAAESARG